jgi:CheY-like chemotaxis protein
MLNGVKVLVVDDDEDSRDLFKVVLELEGAEVVTSASVDEALAALEWFAPDAITSDETMPTRDGFALMEVIRARSPLRGGTVPAIAVTANAFDTDVARSLAGGFDEHLSKPVANEVLVATIARLVGRAPKREGATSC